MKSGQGMDVGARKEEGDGEEGWWGLGEGGEGGGEGVGVCGSL